MSHVSIIGSGKMGQALSSRIAKGGSTIEVFDESDADKPVTGDIVVLAVPYPAVADVIEQRADQLAGKIVVDITNPVNFETFDSLTVPADSSSAAETAAKLPQSRVVKAFNTTFAATLAAGTVGEQVQTTVLIAGDDAEAKTELSEVISEAGLRAIDAGPLRRARELEALGFLQIALAAGDKIPWTGGFGVVV